MYFRHWLFHIEQRHREQSILSIILDWTILICSTAQYLLETPSHSLPPSHSSFIFLPLSSALPLLRPERLIERLQRGFPLLKFSNSVTWFQGLIRGYLGHLLLNLPCESDRQKQIKREIHRQAETDRQRQPRRYHIRLSGKMISGKETDTTWKGQAQAFSFANTRRAKNGPCRIT